MVLLMTRGYTAMGFASGADFLESPLKSAFDYLLIDYKMDDLSGMEVLAQLRREGIETPAAMVSGWETPDLEQLAIEAGFTAFIRKPMLDHMLFSLIGPAEPRKPGGGGDSSDGSGNKGAA